MTSGSRVKRGLFCTSCGQAPHGTSGGGAQCPEATTGTLRTRRPIPTGVCTVPAATSVQTPARTGSPVYKVRQSPPCLVVYGNRRKVRWAVYAPATSCTETVPRPAGPGCTEIGEKRARQGPVRPKSVHDLPTGQTSGVPRNGLRIPRSWADPNVWVARAPSRYVTSAAGRLRPCPPVAPPSASSSQQNVPRGGCVAVEPCHGQGACGRRDLATDRDSPLWQA